MVHSDCAMSNVCSKLNVFRPQRVLHRGQCTAQQWKSGLPLVTTSALYKYEVCMCKCNSFPVDSLHVNEELKRKVIMGNYRTVFENTLGGQVF